MTNKSLFRYLHEDNANVQTYRLYFLRKDNLHELVMYCKSNKYKDLSLFNNIIAT